MEEITQNNLHAD